MKKLPKLASDKEAEDFIDTADLSEYDLSVMKPMQFEFSPKEARVNMRLPGELLTAVKAAAEKAGMPYQRFIRRALEQAIDR